MQEGTAPVPPPEERQTPPARRFSWGRFFLWLLLTPLILAVALVGFLWFGVPPLITASGTITYAEPNVPVSKWLLEAAPALALGKEARIVISADEAASLLASMVDNQVRIRDLTIEPDQVALRAVVQPPGGIPQRFAGPYAVEVTARTRYLPDGRLQAELTSVRLGRLPMPLILVRAALVRSEGTAAPLDPLLLAVEGNVNRSIHQLSHGAARVKDLRLESGSVTLILEANRP